MTRHLIHVAAAVVLATAAGPAARAQSPGDEAEALIRQGTELRRQSQDARALPLFERAYAVARNPRTAAQLGLVKMALGYWVDAERLLDEALASPDHPWIARNVAALQQARAGARENIGELVVTGPTGAEVLINGRPVGKLPLTEALRVDKGLVEIQVRAPLHVPVTQTLKVGGREVRNVTVERLRETPPAATAPPVTASPSPPESVPGVPVVAPAGATGMPDGDGNAGADADKPGGSSVRRPMAWTAAAGAVVGLTLGIVETVVASNRIGDFNGHTGASHAPDCATDQLTDACRALRDDADRARLLAIVGYAGAVVLAATSAALFVVSPRSPARSSGATLACAPSLAAPGAMCRLTF
jgi:hypothetical protein